MASALLKSLVRMTTRIRSWRSSGEGPRRARPLRCEPLEDRALLSATSAADACAEWLAYSSSVGQIVVDLECPDYTLELQASGDYQIVASSLPSTTAEGEPNLPGRLLRFALPMDTDLDSVCVSVQGESSTALAGSFDLVATAAAATETEDGDVLLSTDACLDADGKDVEVYSADACYDSQWCTLVSSQQMGRWKIAEVYYSPFAYNPVTGLVEVVEQASFTLSYSGGDALSAALAASTTCDADAEEIVVNVDDAADWYTSASSSDGSAAATATASYVIITTSAIQANSAQLDEFVAAKQAAGFTVAVETETEWGGGAGDTAADNIRNWLQDNYETLGIEYVLLIGDPTPTTGSVPMKMTYPRSSSSDSYKQSPTDYYYADLTSDWNTDGDSMYGEWPSDISSKPLHEVIVGRIPVYSSDYATLDSVLGKTIAYGSETDIRWRQNLLLAMAISNYAKEDNSSYARCDGSSLGEYIKSNLADVQGYDTYRLYEQAGLTPVTTACDAALTESNLLGAWTTNTYGIVDWWGHGGSTAAFRKYWASDDGDSIPESGEMTWAEFMSSSVTTSLDDTHPSVVFQVSCTNGQPETATNLGYSLLKNGAIATVSASRVSWYSVGTWSPSTGTGYGDNASYAYYGTKRLLENSETETTGNALQWCRENLGTSWGSTSWMNCTDFNLYGDPSITPLAAASNTAPELDNSGSMTLTAIPEDAATNTGTLVSAIIASAGGDRITDADASAVEGVAVTAVVNTNGTWQYSIDGGTTWSSFGTPSDSAARLLASDDNTRIRFVPNADWNGTLDAGITFRAWDQTSGSNGDQADASTNGGTTAFSTATGTAAITVESVNDSPAGADATLTVLEDGVCVLTTADFGFTDPHDSPANALSQVQIATLPGAGTLKLDGAAVVAGQSIDAADVSLGLLTFEPFANTSGDACDRFTFQVQDDGGTANDGVDLDATANTITFDVTPVNDAPEGADATLTTLEDTAFLLDAEDFGFTDPADLPADAFYGILIVTTPDAGTLEYDGAQVAAGQSIPVSDLHRLEFIPAADAYGSPYASFTFRVQDDGGTANAGEELSVEANTITVNVTAVNDLPVVAGLECTPESANLGQVLTLTATGVADPFDPAGSVVSVDFYYESNGIAGLQTGADGDTLLGTDPESSDGWSVSVSTLDRGAGMASYYAQATDNEGATSASTAVSSTLALTYTLDIDGNGTADALTDGFLILRYLFDPEGSWNYSDALGASATRTTRQDIRTYLDGARSTVLDADGNGTADALTDGLLILRYLFDSEGSWDYSDALGASAARVTRDEIREYLDRYNPIYAAAPTTESNAESIAAAATDTVNTSAAALLATTASESTTPATIASTTTAADNSETAVTTETTTTEATDGTALVASESGISTTIEITTVSDVEASTALVGANVPSGEPRSASLAAAGQVDASGADPSARQPANELAVATTAVHAQAADAVLCETNSSPHLDARLAAACAWIDSARADDETADLFTGAFRPGRVPGPRQGSGNRT